MKRILVLTMTVVAALTICSTALANSLTCGHGQTCTSGGPGSGSTGGVFTAQQISHSSGGTLPFTGLNLATVAAIAAVLIASGLTLHWAAGRRS